MHGGGLLQQDPPDHHQRVRYSVKVKSEVNVLPRLKHALVWGTSVKHQPQRVGKDHLLHDEDVVQIVKNVK